MQLRLTGANPLDRELDVRDGLRRTAAQLRAGRKHETKAEARRRKAERAVERDMRDFRSQGAMVAHQRTVYIIHFISLLLFCFLKKITIFVEYRNFACFIYNIFSCVEKSKSYTIVTIGIRFSC